MPMKDFIRCYATTVTKIMTSRNGLVNLNSTKTSMLDPPFNNQLPTFAFL